MVVTNTLPSPEPTPTLTPSPTPYIPETVENPETNYDNKPNATVQRRSFRYGEVRSRLAEAKRNMEITPLRIFSLDETQSTDIVRLAFFDFKKDEIDYVVMPKEEFLSNSYQYLKRSEGGQTVRIQTIKGN